MRCLVVGLGSIGSRHARLLQVMGHDVSCVSRRNDVPFPVFSSIAAVAGEPDFDLVIIASPTARHAHDYEEVLNKLAPVRILVEKPVFASFSQRPENLACHDVSRTRVAYNLRFHPALRRVREALKGQELCSAVFHVGQYLPDWRPQQDYRKGYSADAEQGGGALRDLSHELDLACHLTGSWQALAALGGHVSPLAITSDDVFSLVSVHSKCPHVVIHVNYLDRTPKRHFVINYAQGTVAFDFIENRLTHNGIVTSFGCTADEVYTSQLSAALEGEAEISCTLPEALEVLEMIDAAEEAARAKRWVLR